ncbi:MAG: hypothetical protein KJ069_30350 [Anaerolineae bacterium]|nr:hypothetical protein [Anaerolineae bacterium]
MMEMTAKGIPVSLRPYFQEYNLDDLDPAQDAFTVIERTLMHGTCDELRWLFQVYGREQLRDWTIKAGWRILPRRRVALWAAYFDLKDLPKRNNAWPY